MLRLILLLVMFVLIARSFWSVVDGVVRGASSSPPSPGGGRRGNPGERNSPVPVKMVPCPVCGTFVVPGKALSTTSMRGQAVWFCSEKCRAEYRES